jgi:hypothetical protein
MSKGIKISDLTDEQPERAIAFNENKKNNLAEQFLEGRDFPPPGYTEALLRLGLLWCEKNKRINECEEVE